MRQPAPNQVDATKMTGSDLQYGLIGQASKASTGSVHHHASDDMNHLQKAANHWKKIHGAPAVKASELQSNLVPSCMRAVQHFETWRYYQSTGKAHANEPQNFIVCRPPSTVRPIGHATT